ncbi:MAG: glycosyltransferase family A protein [Acidimicrobiia bacterium]
MTDVLVLMPTFDHRDTLRYSIPSVLAQTVKTLELVVVGDGAPPETAAIVEEIASRDSRVRYASHPKSPRLGEPYRDPLIRESTADVVAYCSDDDLWLPWHLEEMISLLAKADFAHTLGGQVDPDGRLRWWTIDLGQAEDRRYLLEVENTIGLHAAAHTRSSYVALPEGWDTTPAGIPTDYHMWRKFLSQEWVRAASGVRASIVHFPSSLRKDWTLDQRVAEISSWAALVADPDWCEKAWPGVVATAQFESWREAQSNLRSIREYLTEVLEARDQARAELVMEQESGAEAINALRQNAAAALEIERSKAAAGLAAEQKATAAATSAEAQVAALREQAGTAAARLKQVEAHLSWIQDTLTWRIRGKLLLTPGLGLLLRRWRSRSRSSP